MAFYDAASSFGVSLYLLIGGFSIFLSRLFKYWHRLVELSMYLRE